MARRHRRISRWPQRSQRLDSRDARPQRGPGLTSALDTNVVTLLLGNHEPDNRAARDILKDARRSGALLICGVVYSELLAHPKMTPPVLTHFLDETGIEPDFDTGSRIWHEAGLRYARYAARRR